MIRRSFKFWEDRNRTKTNLCAAFNTVISIHRAKPKKKKAAAFFSSVKIREKTSCRIEKKIFDFCRSTKNRIKSRLFLWRPKGEWPRADCWRSTFHQIDSGKTTFRCRPKEKNPNRTRKRRKTKTKFFVRPRKNSFFKPSENSSPTSICHRWNRLFVLFVLDSIKKSRNWLRSNCAYELRKSNLDDDHSFRHCFLFSQQENNWLNEEASKVRAETVKSSWPKTFLATFSSVRWKGRIRAIHDEKDEHSTNSNRHIDGLSSPGNRRNPTGQRKHAERIREKERRLTKISNRCASNEIYFSLAELRSQLMKKEQILAQAKRELDGMSDYKVRHLFLLFLSVATFRFGFRRFKNNKTPKSNVFKRKFIEFAANTSEKLRKWD